MIITLTLHSFRQAMKDSSFSYNALESIYERQEDYFGDNYEFDETELEGAYYEHDDLESVREEYSDLFTEGQVYDEGEMMDVLQEDDCALIPVWGGTYLVAV